MICLTPIWIYDKVVLFRKELEIFQLAFDKEIWLHSGYQIQLRQALEVHWYAI